MRGGLEESVSNVHVRGADVSHDAHAERVVKVLVLARRVTHRHLGRRLGRRHLVPNAAHVGRAPREEEQTIILKIVPSPTRGSALRLARATETPDGGGDGDV